MSEATDLTFAARRTSDFRLIAGVSGAHFVSHFYMMVLPPLFAFVRADYGVNYTEIGLAITVFMAVSAILQTPAGFLVDRYNARLILAAGLFCGALGLFVSAVVHSYWLLVVMFGLIGLGNTVYHPADYSLLSRRIAPERLSQAYSVHSFSGLLGGAIAPAAMLFMHGFVGWRGAFVGAALLGCSAAVGLLMTTNAETEPASARRAGGEAPSTHDWRVLIAGPILINFVFFTLMAFTSFGFSYFSVVALGALHGTDAATANAALSGYLLLSAFGVLAGGLISARTQRHGLAAILGMLGTTLSAALIGTFNLPAMALIAVASLGGFCFGSMLPARDMILRAVTPSGANGRVFGFVTNGFNIGGIVAPLVFGALMDRGEPRLVFWVVAVGGIAAMVSIAGATRGPRTT